MAAEGGSRSGGGGAWGGVTWSARKGEEVGVFNRWCAWLLGMRCGVALGSGGCA